MAASRRRPPWRPTRPGPSGTGARPARGNSRPQPAPRPPRGARSAAGGAGEPGSPGRHRAASWPGRAARHRRHLSPMLDHVGQAAKRRLHPHRRSSAKPRSQMKQELAGGARRRLAAISGAAMSAPVTSFSAGRSCRRSRRRRRRPRASRPRSRPRGAGPGSPSSGTSRPTSARWRRAASSRPRASPASPSRSATRRAIVGGAVGLGLARVRVVLADVRGHGPLRCARSDERDRWRRRVSASLPPAAASIA